MIFRKVVICNKMTVESPLVLVWFNIIEFQQQGIMAFLQSQIMTKTTSLALALQVS